MGVAEAAIAAGGQAEALALRGHVADQRFPSSSKIWVPTGTFSVTSAPLAPVRLRPMPWMPVVGLEMLLEAEIDQRVEAVDGLDPDVAAAAAVAAVRAAELDEFLAPERNAPAPPSPDRI